MRFIAPSAATTALLILLTQSALAQGVGQLRNGLPPTSMDSFVFEAGEDKEHIYGDEGVWDIPPYFEFTKPHRINTGIHDRRDAGLTTGHSEFLPDAWGADEFIGDEWDMSGSGASGGTGPKAPDGSGPAQFGNTMTGAAGAMSGGVLGNVAGAAAAAIPAISGARNAIGAAANAAQGNMPVQPLPTNQQPTIFPFSTAALQSGF